MCVHPHTQVADAQHLYEKPSIITVSSGDQITKRMPKRKYHCSVHLVARSYKECSYTEVSVIIHKELKVNERCVKFACKAVSGSI